MNLVLPHLFMHVHSKEDTLQTFGGRKSFSQNKIFLFRFILRFLVFLSGMLTKYILNARFQNSDFVFEQLKPGIILFAYAAKKYQETSLNSTGKDIYFCIERLASQRITP